MFTFETADRKEVRRFRIAQFNGRAATATASGSAVKGMVRSIVEDKSSNPPVWVITLIRSEPAIKSAMLRPAPRTCAFAEDFL